MRLFPIIFIISQAVVEKAVLPMNMEFPGNISLPLRNGSAHAWRRCKTHQGMKVVRHE